jgi:hypothetical protein
MFTYSIKFHEALYILNVLMDVQIDIHACVRTQMDAQKGRGVDSLHIIRAH